MTPAERIRNAVVHATNSPDEITAAVLAALAPEMAVVALSSAMASHWSEWMPGKEWVDRERAIKVRLVNAATALPGQKP